MASSARRAYAYMSYLDCFDDELAVRQPGQWLKFEGTSKAQGKGLTPFIDDTYTPPTIEIHPREVTTKPTDLDDQKDDTLLHVGYLVIHGYDPSKLLVLKKSASVHSSTPQPFKRSEAKKVFRVGYIAGRPRQCSNAWFMVDPDPITHICSLIALPNGKEKLHLFPEFRYDSITSQRECASKWSDAIYQQVCSQNAAQESKSPATTSTRTGKQDGASESSSSDTDHAQQALADTNSAGLGYQKTEENHHLLKMILAAGPFCTTDAQRAVQEYQNLWPEVQKFDENEVLGAELLHQTAQVIRELQLPIPYESPRLFLSYLSLQVTPNSDLSSDQLQPLVQKAIAQADLMSPRSH